MSARVKQALTFQQAIELVDKGGRVRLKHWPAGAFVFELRVPTFRLVTKWRAGDCAIAPFLCRYDPRSDMYEPFAAVFRSTNFLDVDWYEV